MKFAVLLFSILFAAGSFAAQNDIPVTTTSKEAMQHFHKGLHFLDVGRGVESRRELLKAVEIDPSFTHAYYFLSLASLTPEEFKQSLDRGMKSSQAKSEGEKMLIEINQTFLDNNADQRIALSKS